MNSHRTYQVSVEDHDGDRHPITVSIREIDWENAPLPLQLVRDTAFNEALRRGIDAIGTSSVTRID